MIFAWNLFIISRYTPILRALKLHHELSVLQWIWRPLAFAWTLWIRAYSSLTVWFSHDSMQVTRSELQKRGGLDDEKYAAFVKRSIEVHYCVQESARAHRICVLVSSVLFVLHIQSLLFLQVTHPLGAALKRIATPEEVRLIVYVAHNYRRQI